MPVHHARRARAARPRRFRCSVEPLEGRALLATLGLDSATIRPDGRIVELVFSGPLVDPVGLPDWSPAAAAGRQLVTSTGVALEPLGSVVTTADSTLTWTTSFLVADPTQVLVYGADPLTLSGAAGLFDDGSGNQTAALNAAPVVNRSLVDADGFTTDQFQRGNGGVTLYVSSTYGNDARGFNQAQNPATPLRSLQLAFNMLRDSGQNGRGAAIRLLRGDIFTGDAKMTVSGQDRDHPFVLEDYWQSYGDGRADPKSRPIIRSNMKLYQNDGLSAEYGASGTSTMDHVVIRRLQFDIIGRSNSDTAGTGLKVWMAGTNWTVDDSVFDDFRSGIGIADTSKARISDFTILRSIVTDSHYNGVGPEINNAHSQGLYGTKVDNLLISQSTFDRNGRTTSNYGGRNIYSHNIYIQSDSGLATIWGNMIRGGGSHGVQMRSGGILAYNYMARNAIASFIAYPGGSTTHNIVELAEDINTLGRGFGVSLIGDNINPVPAGVLEYNILVNEVGKQPRALYTDQGKNGILNGLVRNNTLVNAGYIYSDSQLAPNTGHSLRVELNLVISGSDPALYASPTSGSDDWYDSDRNLLYANNPDSTFAYVKGGNVGWNNWLQQTDTELSSIRVAPRLVSPYAGIAGYLSNSTETSIVNQFRERRPNIWSSTFDALAIYRYFATAYRPTNLSSPAGDSSVFYGAVDPRLSAPDLIAASDNGVSNSDNITSVDRNLTFAIGSTAEKTNVELWRGNLRVATRPGGGGLSQLVDPGPVAKGTYDYTIRQVDGAGNRLVSPPITVTIGSASDDPPPPPPPAPPLQAAAPAPPDLAGQSDTGLSNSDNITKISKNLIFLIGATSADSTVELWRGDLRVASSSGGPALTNLIDPGPVPDGTHAYTIRQVNADGAWAGSTPTRVTVDTIRPTTPPAPDLIAQSDTGVSSSDNITGNRSPEFLLTTSEPDSLVGLVRRPLGSNEGFRWFATRIGSGMVTEPGPLADGSYEYSTIVMDVAGNYSSRSLVLIVTIQSDSAGG